MSNSKRKYTIYATKEKIAKISDENKQLIHRFFVGKTQSLSESTKKSYESDFNQFFIYIAENYQNRPIISMMKKKDFQQDGSFIWIEDMEEIVYVLEDYIAFCITFLGNNERRVQRRISSLSSLFIFMKKKRMIKENPVEMLDRPKVKKKDKQQIKQTFLTLEQVDEIREKLSETGDVQLELFFEFGISTMARANAISNVKIEQIDLVQRRVVDILEKEQKLVKLYFSERCSDLIREWIDKRQHKGIDSPYLFITKYAGKWDKVAKGTLQSSWIKKIGDLIGIPELHCHDLRHSGSDILHKMGVKLETISALLNHEGTQVTQDHYIQIDHDKIQEEKDKFQF